MGLAVLLCVLGFLLLYGGAEWLVRGSSALARSLGVTPVVIGLTVVAFGTSAPELVVSLVSSLEGKSMIAVGNVVGSNICNLALVLGLAAVFIPITAHRSVVRREIPLMLGISLCLVAISLDSELSRLEGGVLLLGIVAYVLRKCRVARRREAGTRGAGADPGGSLPRRLLLVAAGIAGVVGGAEVVVASAVRIMGFLGVGERFVGLTVVAFGTSLPELATSVVAALRREMDISIGNLVGSNVFNVLSVLGAAAVVRPVPIPGGLAGSGLAVDFGVMVLTGLLPLLLMWRSLTLSRGGGALLLATYGAYLAWLVARA